jgi:L-methionine (R)-S-oxide reductase
MHIAKSTADLSKSVAYRELQGQLTALFVGERNGLANSANMSALLYEALPNLNWAEFYFLQGRELVLGPSQGDEFAFRLVSTQRVKQLSCHLGGGRLSVARG